MKSVKHFSSIDKVSASPVRHRTRHGRLRVRRHHHRARETKRTRSHSRLQFLSSFLFNIILRRKIYEEEKKQRK